MEKNSPETRKKALEIYQGIEDTIGYLYDRWQDEKYDEDFNDYSKKMEYKIVDLGGKFVKASRRPFGCQFDLDNCRYKIFVGSGKIGYQRIS